MRHHLGSLYKAAYSLLNSCSGNIRLLESAEIAFRRQDQWRRFTTGGPCPSLSALFGTGQLPHILNHSIRGVRTGPPLHDAATLAEAPSINPLQQIPSPTAQGALDADDDERRRAARAVLRGVAISPKKLNLFARLLRGLHVDDALIQCRMHPKKSARICEKVLLSARANAVNNHGLTQNKLKVDEAWVGKGTHLKRISVHGRGRSSRLLKYRSHLTIVLKEEAVRRRTVVLPMLAERAKWKARVEGKGLEGETGMAASGRTDGVRKGWWKKWQKPERRDGRSSGESGSGSSSSARIVDGAGSI